MDGDDLGPIDLVVIGYPAGAPITGEAVPLMMDLVERGVIRVLDATFVVKHDDGTVSGVSADADDDGAGWLGDFRAFRGARSEVIGDDDLARIADALEPGEGAAVILYENSWAGPFSAAVRRSGGRLVASERIGVQDLIDQLDALEAN